MRRLSSSPRRAPVVIAIRMSRYSLGHALMRAAAKRRVRSSAGAEKIRSAAALIVLALTAPHGFAGDVPGIDPADMEPSAVRIVQPSSMTFTSDEPAVIIGSIAIVIPSERRGPRPGSPKFGMCGSSW